MGCGKAPTSARIKFLMEEVRLKNGGLPKKATKNRIDPRRQHESELLLLNSLDEESIDRFLENQLELMG